MTVNSVDTLQDLGLTQPLDTHEMERELANWSHWQANARRFGEHHAASWDDEHLIELEIINLLKHLSSEGRRLDAGCANGYTTFRTLQQRPREFLAFDFAPLMIEQARLLQQRCDPEGTITFSHGNVLQIDEPSDSFDEAYTVRVLINLPSWEVQQRAIRELHRVLKPGGRYILSEAFTGSQTRLNALREIANLPPLAEREINLYLEENRLEAFLRPHFEISLIERFSSLYYVASRFLRELAVEPDAPQDYHHPINKLIAGIESGSRSGDFGIQKAYLLTKL